MDRLLIKVLILTQGALTSYLIIYYSNNDYLLKCKQEASFELSKFMLSKAEGYKTKANVLRISDFKFPDFSWPFV